MSTSESISNKAGNATGGVVGEETLLHQATTLASHSVEYAKGVVGLGSAKPASSPEDAANNKQGPAVGEKHTLGDLVNEARGLAAHTLETAKGYVAPPPKEGDAVASYADSLKQTVASGIDKAASFVAVKQGEAEKVAADVQKTAEVKKDEASKKAEGVQAEASNLAASATDAANKTVNSAIDKI